MGTGLQECNAKVALKGRYLSLHLQAEPPTFDPAGLRSSTLNQPQVNGYLGKKLGEPGARELARISKITCRLKSREMGCSAVSYSQHFV